MIMINNHIFLYDKNSLFGGYIGIVLCYGHKNYKFESYTHIT